MWVTLNVHTCGKACTDDENKRYCGDRHIYSTLFHMYIHFTVTLNATFQQVWNTHSAVNVANFNGVNLNFFVEISKLTNAGEDVCYFCSHIQTIIIKRLRLSFSMVLKPCKEQWSVSNLTDWFMGTYSCNITVAKLYMQEDSNIHTQMGLLSQRYLWDIHTYIHTYTSDHYWVMEAMNK